MFKSFTRFSLLLMMAFWIVACSTETPAEPTEAPAPEAEVKPTEAPAPEAAPTEAPADETDHSAMDMGDEQIRIAIVMPSATTDLAWSQAIYDALVTVQTEMGGEDAVEIAFSEGMFNVGDAAAALRDYAADGYDLVIAHGTQYGSSLFEIAPDFPETAFAYGTSRDTGESEGHANIYAYDAQADEGGFVNGVIAANLTETNVIGIIGPVEAGDAKLYIDGFVNGVHAVNPDIDVQIAYTGSFGDTALAAETANTHIASGADVLTGSAQQVVGAIGVAAEANIPWLATQQDQSPIAEDIVVATQQYDWTAMVRSILANMHDDKFGGELFELTLENDGLSMQYGNLNQSVIDAAEAAISAIRAGDFDPSDAEGTMGVMAGDAMAGGDDGMMMETPEIEPVRIAIVMPSGISDLAWSQSIYESIAAVQAMYDEGTVEIAYSEGMFNVADAAIALRDYAADGYDIVMAHGTQYGTSLFEIAPDFPETAFVYGTSRDTGEAEGLENISAYDAQADEGGFINGVIAANLTKSGVIGIVAPIEAGDAKLYIDGFVAGVASVNDSDVLIAYTGSFGDIALAAETANTHIAAGADVLTGSAQQVVGAIGVANEQGIPWLGTQYDQSPVAPNAVVATQLYDWSAMVLDVIVNAQAGTYGGSLYELTLANHGLTMVYGDSLSAEVIAAADAAVEGIVSGEISPQ